MATAKRTTFTEAKQEQKFAEKHHGILAEIGDSDLTKEQTRELIREYKKKKDQEQK